MTTESIITISVIGLYTIVNLIVFFIQKAQIDSSKDITSSMKSFIDIFKIDEVKKYIEMRDERIIMQVDNIIAKNDTIKKMMDEVVNENVDKIKTVYIEQMGAQHLEMTGVIIRLLKSIPKDKRLLFIEYNLKANKHVFIPMLDDIENNKI
jgi:hypothetical protein